MSLKIAFVSNFINHHQIPFCDEMYKRLGDDFAFIQVQPMDESRSAMGWSVDASRIPYLHILYEAEQECTDLIKNSDMLLIGWTGQEKGSTIDRLITQRLESGQPAIRISERIYREGRFKAISPRGLVAKYNEHVKYRKSPVYLLCAGAYVSGDFRMIGAYPGKMFKWGYFPPLKRYDESKLNTLLYEEGDVLQLCFAGRLIKLKHPEIAVRAAEFLDAKGKECHVHIVGDGPMRPELEGMVREKKLTEKVTFYGSMAPDRVREIMEKSHIFLFGSNYLEGWGAVVGEALNSACAVVASREAGAVPFLIDDGENGITYDNCDEKEFLDRLDELTDSPEKIKDLQKKGYETIVGLWNAEVAATRLLSLCDAIIQGADAEKGNSVKLPVFENGPVSMADIIKAPGFMRTLQEDNHLE